MAEIFSSVFEGFAIQVSEPVSVPVLQDLLAPVLGSGWNVNPFGDRVNDLATRFDVTPIEQKISVSEAWQLTYRLRSLPGVLYAEPLFEVAVSGRPDWRGEVNPELLAAESFQEAVDPGLLLCGIGANFRHLDESNEFEWSLKQMHVLEAWNRFFPDGGKLPGEGIVIGHPDTGYQPHPEIFGNLLPDLGKDFLHPNDLDATDELEKPFGVLIPNPGHGTGTSSVIISSQGDQTPDNDNKNFVSGIAPGAKLIPLRMTYSVVLVGMMKLAQAIEYATDRGAHIISISLGGLGEWRLRSAITYAQEKGVIILAAAGNCVPFVVFPAAYEEVIAVAACNAKREIWRGSSTGERVDVTAPGESVWHAQVKKDDEGAITFGVDRGNGTSFAVAAVAGVAALWLSYHGRDKLIEKYGIEKIPFIFNRILRDSCDRIPDWDSRRVGTGLVNAEKVLAAPLPDRFEELMVSPALDLEEHIPLDEGRIETFSHLFEQSLTEVRVEGVEESLRSNAVLESKLAELLGVSVAELPRRLKEVGQELAFHLATNPDVYKAFVSLMSQEKLSSKSMKIDERVIAGTGNSIAEVRQVIQSKDISEVLKQRLNN